MIRIVFYTLVVILVLSFFGVSIQSVVHSPAGQANFGYIGSLILAGWNFIVDLLVGVITWLRHLIP